ncbi:MAG: serine/threonine protein kinase, partial [Polyangiaceae bacterium]|nr:serine/threonine protein kinase [Polyangiaceae bacterium]
MADPTDDATPRVAPREPGDACDGDGDATTRRVVGAPELLADEHERRKRDLVRAALFGAEAEPARIGRFVPLRRLGAGGMGVVYAARDEQLDRDVAIKLLRSDVAERAEDRVRMLREAQALASLAHPNVVTVYEVGFDGDRLFIAMELVRGVTLSRWLGAETRSVREVLDVFAAVGRGLAAAHVAGLVHRDLKPDNVILDESGTAKVLDFGLARRVGATPDAPAPASSDPAPEPEPEPGASAAGADATPALGGSVLGRDLTRTGTVMGTPAYMAPEQFGGAAVDARTDQFAFSVALHEALYGARPFRGASYDALARAVLSGELAAPPAGRDVPAWLRRIVVRGLSRDPADRFPSMPALLAALADDPAPRRRRRMRAALGLVVAAGATLGLVLGLRPPPAPPPCEGGAARVAEGWGAAERAAVRAGLGSSSARHAGDTAERTVAVLDGYAGAWAGMHREACLATERGEQSGELLDARMRCLEARRGELGALGRVLAEGAPGTLDRAVAAAMSLAPLGACADAAALLAEVEPPEDAAVREAVEAVRAELRGVMAEVLTGQSARGLERARAALAAAERTGYRPVVAEAALEEGNVHEARDDHAAAAGAFERAYFEGLASRHDPVAAQAALGLYTIFAYHQGKPELAGPWEQSAGALVERAAGDVVLRADFLNSRGLVRAELGRLDEAAADYAAALAAYEQALGAEHLKVALALSNMAQVTYLLGRHADAAATLERALAIRLRALGEDHPDVAAVRSNLGLVRLAEGEIEVAIELFEQALGAEERALGPAHPSVTFVHPNLGQALAAAGRTEEAVAHYRTALAILVRDPSSSPLRVARTQASLGGALHALGRRAEARSLLEEALATRRRALPADHRDTAASLVELGLLCLDEGALPEAVSLLREGVGMLARVAVDPVDEATALTALGRALRATRDLAAAEVALERAVELHATGGRVPGRLRGEARLLLARVLV